ncbi:MAG TPA: response regulator transcription factor [Verrucomicrobiae bacterium]|nr:response regulator transcription factor [Verrucomicrobiae bacterium]
MMHTGNNARQGFRILIADDHAVVRRGLAQIMADSAHTFTIEEAADGEEALMKVAAGDFDLVLVDITMPRKGGLEVVGVLKETRPLLPVLVISVHREEQYVSHALRAGAAGYVTKDRASEELLTAVHRVLQGERYVSASPAEPAATVKGRDAPAGRTMR